MKDRVIIFLALFSLSNVLEAFVDDVKWAWILRDLGEGESCKIDLRGATYLNIPVVEEDAPDLFPDESPCDLREVLRFEESFGISREVNAGRLAAKRLIKQGAIIGGSTGVVIGCGGGQVFAILDEAARENYSPSRKLEKSNDFFAPWRAILADMFLTITSGPRTMGSYLRGNVYENALGIISVGTSFFISNLTSLKSWLLSKVGVLEFVDDGSRQRTLNIKGASAVAVGYVSSRVAVALCDERFFYHRNEPHSLGIIDD